MMTMMKSMKRMGSPPEVRSGSNAASRTFVPARAKPRAAKKKPGARPGQCGGRAIPVRISIRLGRHRAPVLPAVADVAREHRGAGGAELPPRVVEAIADPVRVGDRRLAQPHRVRRAGVHLFLRVGED